MFIDCNAYFTCFLGGVNLKIQHIFTYFLSFCFVAKTANNWRSNIEFSKFFPINDPSPRWPEGHKYCRLWLIVTQKNRTADDQSNEDNQLQLQSSSQPKGLAFQGKWNGFIFSFNLDANVQEWPYLSL